MPKPKKNESKQDFLSRCTGEVMGEGKEQDQAYAMCNAYWDEAKGTRNALSLSAPFELAKKDGEEARGFMITAYTGQVIDLGWWGKFVFDVEGMKAKEKFPVLREHYRDRVVGIGARTWKDGKNFFIGGDFAKTRDGKEVLSLAEEGFPWQASVGIWPTKIKSLKDDKESATVNGAEITGPAEIWLESRVGEVSFVALGADDQTAAIVLSDRGVPVEIHRSTILKEEVKIMTKDELKKEYPELVAEIQAEARKDGVEAGRTEGEKTERARVTEILAAGADPAVTREVIEQGVPAAESYKQFYTAEKAKKAAALDELEKSAPESMGQKPPVIPEKKAGQAELMEKAKVRAREKKITVVAAMREIQAENPELLDASLPKFHVVVDD